jgi:hypothetical protein
MSPGATEEAGETARGIVNALKTQPVVLGLLLINMLFIAFLWIAMHEQSGRKDQLILELVRISAACPQAIQVPKLE